MEQKPKSCEEKSRYTYGVRNPVNHRMVNFDDRKSAWEYARHLGVKTVVKFEIRGNVIHQKKDKEPFMI